jgi:hypothetical protein
MTNPYVRSLLRFWWVVVIGLVVAQLFALLVVFQVDFSSIPPKLTERSKPTYTATGRLLVNSPQVPYVRISVTSEAPAPTGGTPLSTGTPTGPQNQTVLISEVPETQTLVRAANFYPLVIEGDEVEALREEVLGKKFGGLVRGRVQAQATYSFVSRNRVESGSVPVIDLAGTADSPKDAVTLVQSTIEAFQNWVVSEQKRAKVKPIDRILIEPLQTPRGAVAVGGTSKVFPLLVFVAVAMAFGALAILLDRVFPVRPVVTRAEPVEPSRAA